MSYFLAFATVLRYKRAVLQQMTLVSTVADLSWLPGKQGVIICG